MQLWSNNSVKHLVSDMFDWFVANILLSFQRFAEVSQKAVRKEQEMLFMPDAHL